MNSILITMFIANPFRVFYAYRFNYVGDNRRIKGVGIIILRLGLSIGTETETLTDFN